MCIHACTDICIKFCDDLWGDTQEMIVHMEGRQVLGNSSQGREN